MNDSLNHFGEKGPGCRCGTCRRIRGRVPRRRRGRECDRAGPLVLGLRMAKKSAQAAWTSPSVGIGAKNRRAFQRSHIRPAPLFSTAEHGGSIAVKSARLKGSTAGKGRLSAKKKSGTGEVTTGRRGQLQGQGL